MYLVLRLIFLWNTYNNTSARTFYQFVPSFLVNCAHDIKISSLDLLICGHIVIINSFETEYFQTLILNYIFQVSVNTYICLNISTPYLMFVSCDLKRVSLSQTEKDILLRKELDEVHKNHPDKLNLWYTLDKPSEGTIHLLI